MTSKLCKACHIEKLVSDFSTGRGVCKKCLANKHRIWRHSMSPEEYAAERDRVNKRRQERLLLEPKKILWQQCRQSAKDRGLEFTIQISDIPDIPEICAVLSIPLEFATGYPSDNSPSVDRIDNSRGYVPGNIAIISRRANSLKKDATITEITGIIAYMESHLGTCHFS